MALATPATEAIRARYCLVDPWRFIAVTVVLRICRIREMRGASAVLTSNRWANAYRANRIAMYPLPHSLSTDLPGLKSVSAVDITSRDLYLLGKRFPREEELGGDRRRAAGAALPGPQRAQPEPHPVPADRSGRCPDGRLPALPDRQRRLLQPAPVQRHAAVGQR